MASTKPTRYASNFKQQSYGSTYSDGNKQHPDDAMTHGGAHSAMGAGRVDDVIERLTAKSRRFQYLAAVVCGLANASDAVEVLCLGFVLDHLDGGISDQNKGERGDQSFSQSVSQ